MNHMRNFKSTPHLKPLPLRKATTVSVLDIGTQKIVCLIADLQPMREPAQDRNHSHTARIIGIGHQPSAGLKGSIVTSPEAAEQAIRHAVAAAERMARVEVSSVIVNLSAGRIGSLHTQGQLTLNQPVRLQDIDNLHAMAGGSCGHSSRALIHSLPIEYRLDGEPHISDPVGMVGSKLGVEMHLVSIDNPVTQNLTMVIERCWLDVAGFVASSYASGLATLTDDEMDMGCVLLDIGANSTNIGVFDRGHFVHADAIAMGGNHITMDIARGLTLRFSVAERLKIMHGSALWDHKDDRNTVPVPQSPDSYVDTPGYISKGQLSRIIQPRAEEILEFTKNRLVQAGFSRHMQQRIILTGGSSQLNRIDNLSTNIMGGFARIGTPSNIREMPKAAMNPAFATAAGLLAYPQFAYKESFEHLNLKNRYAATGTDHYLSRFGRWLKDSF